MSEVSLSWCHQGRFKIHWVDANLLSTYKVQALLSALWAEGEQRRPKSLPAAGRPPALKGDKQSSMEQSWRQDMPGGKPGAVHRWVVGGCRFLGCSGKASLGEDMTAEARGREEGREPACCSVEGNTPQGTCKGAWTGVSLVT